MVEARMLQVNLPSVEDGQHWVYVLRCAGDSLFVGRSRQLRTRLQALAMGKGARAVTDRLPYSLIAAYPCPDESKAIELWELLRSYSPQQLVTTIGRATWIEGVRLVPLVSIGEDAQEIAPAKILSTDDLRSFSTLNVGPATIERPPAESFVDCLILAISKELAPREQAILTCRFGLSDGRPQTLRDIADDQGLSRERVRQLVNRSLLKLYRRGRSEVKRHNYSAPCAKLCLCIDGVIAPDDSDAAAHVFDFIRAVLAHLTDYAATCLVLRLSGYNHTAIAEQWQKVREVADEYRARQKEQARRLAPQRKFLACLDRHVEWFSEPYLTGFTPALARSREVNDYEHSGTFYSDKLEREVQYESQLELEFLLKLDQTDAVTYFQEQPFYITYEMDGRYRRYFPDVLFTLDDGRTIITEIKPTRLMGQHSNLSKWKALENYCRQQGFGLLITDGKRSIVSMRRREVPKDFEQAILKILEARPLSTTEFFSLCIEYRRTSSTYNDLVTIVLRNDLIWKGPSIQVTRRRGI